ncbi:MAG TPA: competence protein ComEC, partial [Pseudomonas sp.]|nr:competence protein ComEC [Pseudomonas sp.]
TRLDLLLLSHADNDHSGGADAVQRLLRVDRVVSGEPSRLAPDLGAERCESGSSWQWNDVRFSLWQWQMARDSNQHSCVLQIEANGERMLLTGDIDQAAERAWLASEQRTPSHWLLLPHHGSRSSSSEPFLRGVASHAALISRSLHNAFGHPHPSVVERLEILDIRAYDTAVHGAIRIELGSFSPPRLQRSQRRFWREK